MRSFHEISDEILAIYARGSEGPLRVLTRQQDQANADRMRAENLQRTEPEWTSPLGWAERDNRAML